MGDKIFKLTEGMIQVAKYFVDFKWNIEDFIEVTSDELDGEKRIVIKKYRGN